jgi:hypothetical protein
MLRGLLAWSTPSLASLPAPHDADGPRQSVQHARALLLARAYVPADDEGDDAYPSVERILG